jgi:hypothetical protein
MGPSVQETGPRLMPSNLVHQYILGYVDGLTFSTRRFTFTIWLPSITDALVLVPTP